MEDRGGEVRGDARRKQIAEERRSGGPHMAAAAHETGYDRDVHAVGVHLLIPGDLVEERLERAALVAVAAQVGGGVCPRG